MMRGLISLNMDNMQLYEDICSGRLTCDAIIGSFLYNYQMLENAFEGRSKSETISEYD